MLFCVKLRRTTWSSATLIFYIVLLSVHLSPCFSVQSFLSTYISTLDQKFNQMIKKTLFKANSFTVSIRVGFEQLSLFIDTYLMKSKRSERCISQIPSTCKKVPFGLGDNRFISFKNDSQHERMKEIIATRFILYLLHNIRRNVGTLI